MPIVDVTIVVGRGETIAADLTQTLADVVGRALNSPPSQTWVRLQLLAYDRYAENESNLTSTELPVFVVVLARQLPDQLQLVETIAERWDDVIDAIDDMIDTPDVDGTALAAAEKEVVVTDDDAADDLSIADTVADNEDDPEEAADEAPARLARHGLVAEILADARDLALQPARRLEQPL